MVEIKKDTNRRKTHNFMKVLSKTVTAVYPAYTYGFAIRGYCANRSLGL
jgi:hypothetical protein